MTPSGRRGNPDEIFEILVTSYGQKPSGMTADADLCWRPATDVYENETEFVVQVDLAGMDPAQIQVDCDGETVVIKGVRSETADPGHKHFHTMEINVGPFVRRVPVIQGVDPETATARYRGGFLFVTFRKGEPRSPRRRQIAIDR